MSKWRTVAFGVTWVFVALGALVGFGLPAAGVAVYHLMRGMGVALAVNYWHFLVAPAIGGVVGYSLAKSTKGERARARSRELAVLHAHAVLDEVGTGVYRSTLEGKLLFATQTLAELFGYKTVEEILKVPVTGLYARAADRQELLADLREHGSVEGRVLPFVARDGKQGLLSMTAHLQATQIVGVLARVARPGDESLVVLCSNCDQARGTDGKWQKLSRYLMEHGEAVRKAGCVPVFSHGLCAPCAELLYGDVLKD